MIEPHVNKQTHVLGGQGVIHSLLPGVLTDASHTHRKLEKTQKQSTILSIWADSWYPQSTAMVEVTLWTQWGCLLYGCSLPLVSAYVNLLGRSYY